MPPLTLLPSPSTCAFPLALSAFTFSLPFGVTCAIVANAALTTRFACSLASYTCASTADYLCPLLSVISLSYSVSLP